MLVVQGVGRAAKQKLGDLQGRVERTEKRIVEAKRVLLLPGRC